jgi:hypothetical protein
VARPFEHTRLTLVFALFASACGSQPHAEARAPESQAADEHLEEPYLPVRTEFSVILEQPIGTHLISPTQTFSARVRHPVRSPENEIIIQTGAHVHGRVIAVEDKPAVHIKIRFDDVETTWGPAAITATIRTAEPYASSMSGMEGGNGPYDAALFMPVSDTAPLPGGLASGRPSQGGPAITGGPRAFGGSTILLPKGAELRIMLVKPLVAPPRVRSSR